MSNATPLRFGLAAPIFASPGVPEFRTPSFVQLEWAPILESVREAERLGYDSVWVSDHLFLGDQGSILESWTTLSALATVTSEIRLVNNHLSNEFRWAPLIARMAATLDFISGGRFELFLSPGTRDREYPAYGYNLEPRARRIERLSEAIEVIKGLLRGGAFDYDGEFYQLRGAISNPASVQPGGPPVWVADGDDDASLRIAASQADGWNILPADVDELAMRIDRLAHACAAVDRPFDSLKKALETEVLIVDSDEEWQGWLTRWTELREEYPIGAAMSDYVPVNEPLVVTPDAYRSKFVIGTRAEVTERLLVYQDLGFTDIVCYFIDFPSLKSMRTLATEIRPQLKSAR